MPFEQYKTQVLLLHSQQGILDTLSAGFNDKFSVHCATTGSEALNTLGETPIHVIVSAQDLPGMSGLEALREAKKRSPDTIGILLAGADKSDGLEALVGDKEVFQIVRGNVTPESLLSVVESATQRVRLLALAESANDNAANVDEPMMSESIVMETSENGSLIISDGTGRMPALKPQKIDLTPDRGAREVDLLVMTRDEEFLATISDSARGLHHLHHAVTPTQAEDFVRDKKVGVLITDAAMVGSEVENLIHKLRTARSRMVAIVAGRRDDGEMLMDLINRGHVYRFLLKPVSPGRARLAIEASVKHHIEAPDAAFRPKPPGRRATRPLARAKPAAKPTPAPTPKPATKPAPRPAPKQAAKQARKPQARPPVPKPPQRPATKPVTRKKGEAAPRIEPVISAPSATDRLYDAGNARQKIRATMTGIADSVDRTVQASGEAVADAVSSALAPARKHGMLGIVCASIAACAIGVWVYLNWESVAPHLTPAVPAALEEDAAPRETETVATVVESDIRVPLPRAEVQPEAETAVPSYQALLDEARLARGAGNLIEPAGDNAVERYLAVLEEAPDDPVVAEEFQNVVEQVLGMAEAAILEQEIEDAGAALAMLRLADPGNSRLAFLDAQLTQIRLRATVDEARVAIRDGLFEDAGRLISEARRLAGGASAEIDSLSEELAAARSRQKVDEVLGLAGEHLAAGNLVTPSNNNARYYYELALSNDPDNQAAQQGLTIVASKLVLRAREAIDDGRLEDAGRLLGGARELDPSSSELAASSKALDSALEGRAEAERQAEAARLAELERQAEDARLAEIRRQEEEARLERIREAERQNTEQVASAAATTSELGVAGSKVRNSGGNVAPASGGNVASPPAAPRTPPKRSVQGNAGAAPAPEAGQSEAADMPSITMPLTAGVAEGARTFGMDASASRTSLPGNQAQAASAAAPQNDAARDTAVPISSLTRTNYVAPDYPRSAQRRNLSGSVDLMFTVSTIGTVKDVHVIKGEPEGVFDLAAIDAVSQWRFDPVIEDGVALEKRTAVRLSFNLE